jgi:hypothetical protein
VAVITSVELNALDVMDGAIYDVGRPTVIALSAMSPRSAVLVQRQNAPPVFQRFQPEPRTVPLEILLKQKMAPDRRDAFETLKAAAGFGLVPLVWVEGAATYTLLVAVEEFVPNAWFTRATASAIAPDPDPVVT